MDDHHNISHTTKKLLKKNTASLDHIQAFTPSILMVGFNQSIKYPSFHCA